MNVVMLKPEDIAAYLTHMRAADSQSGVDGLPHFHPYGRDEPYDMEAAIVREQKRWATPLNEPGWRRAWGIFDSDATRPVGHLYLEGGMLLSAMHRVGMGMGLAISRTIAEAHGGSLEFRRNPERGVSFVLTIPTQVSS